MSESMYVYTPAAKAAKMMDYTSTINDDPSAFPVPSNVQDLDDPFAEATKITMDMLRKRPDIKKALLAPLKEMLVPWEDKDREEPDDWIDSQIANAMNLDPFIQTTVFECLNGMGDIAELEGDEMYFPSIFTMDTVGEIEKQTALGGFREDHAGTPAKYVHLSQKHQTMIYVNPETRKFLSTMPAENITEAFVEQLCNK
jgi:hypothetical protein